VAVSGIQKGQVNCASDDGLIGPVDERNSHLLKPIAASLKRSNRLDNGRGLDKQSTLHSLAVNCDIGYHHRRGNLRHVICPDQFLTGCLLAMSYPEKNPKRDTSGVKASPTEVSKEIWHRLFTCFLTYNGSGTLSARVERDTGFCAEAWSLPDFIKVDALTIQI
jgi:hypothetical protein